MNETSLKTIGQGAAVELFDAELQKILDNIADPNTAAETVREVSLVVKIRPNDDRTLGGVEITAKSKPAGYKPFATYLYLSSDGETVRAFEPNDRQPELFTGPVSASSVVDITEEESP